MAGTAYSNRDRSFSGWRVAPAAHVREDSRSLIALVNFCSFASCALLYAGVLPLKPSLHRLGLLVVRALDGLLRREAQRVRYLPMLRTCKFLPYSWLMSWLTAARLYKQKSIFNCSGRLRMMRL